MRRILLSLVFLPLLCIAGGESSPPRPSSSRADGSRAVQTIDAQVAITNTTAPLVNFQPVFAGTNGVTAFARNMDSLDDRQKLAVGDTVTYRVVEDQEDPKLLAITDVGELDIPELGLVTASGKTCKQLGFEIKSKLEQATYYHATVIIGVQLLNKTMSGRRVYVAGQVRKAGPQEIPAGEAWTVSKAILNAGGFTEYADKKKVRLVRSGAKDRPGKTLVLNVAEIWEKGRTELDLPVETEDLIYVPARAINFY